MDPVNRTTEVVLVQGADLEALVQVQVAAELEPIKTTGMLSTRLVIGALAFLCLGTPCPLSDADRRSYTAWGLEQSPRLRFESCAAECSDGVRACLFLDPDSEPHLAVCNGSQSSKHAEPCQLRARDRP